MLIKLTGGYRRTPVMQIGADIYCDSQCIIRELERRHPTPTLLPASQGLMWCLSRWADGEFFKLSVQMVLGAAGDALPKDFAEDRGRLYLGPDWANELKSANATLPHIIAQLRAPLLWLNEQLSDGRNFLLGDAPAAIDAQFYCCIWFLRGRWAGGPAFLSEFPNLERWETNVEKIGHGEMSDMSPEDAITRAAECDPLPTQGVAPHEPQGFTMGQKVVISPDVDGGEQPVEGAIVFADAETITVSRTEPDAGAINVHFPRAGYKVKAAD